MILHGQQLINVGASPNDKTGDPLRTAFQKVNTNLTAIYDSLGKRAPLTGTAPGLTAGSLSRMGRTPLSYFSFYSYDGEPINVQHYYNQDGFYMFPGAGTYLRNYSDTTYLETGTVKFLNGNLGYSTGRLGKGWFTDLEVTNGIAGSITGNAATVTGYTPASGSLILSGADAITLTTTAATSVTLPTSGTLTNTTDVSAQINDSIAARMGEGTTATTVGLSFLTLANPTAIRVPLINANNSVTATATTGTGNIVLSSSPVFTTPNIGTATGSVSGNAGTVTGYTPASGSLTLSGADAITVTTTAATSVTLPTSGTLTNTTDVSAQINDSIVDRLEDAVISIARADSGLMTSGGYATGFDWYNGIEGNVIKAAKKFTTISPVLAHPVSCIGGILTGQTTMTDGRAQYQIYYIPEPITVTGVRFVLQTQGNYTADEYNGAKLYQITSAAGFTRLDSTANNGDFWKGTVVQKQDFAFTGGARILEPGLYVVGFIWNASATTAAPVMYTSFNNSSATNVMYWGNAGADQTRLGGYVATQTDLAVIEAFTDLTAEANAWGVFLY
jgi:hypothetical protein